MAELDEEEAILVKDMLHFLQKDVMELMVRIKSSLLSAEKRWMRMEGEEQATGKSMKAAIKVEVVATKADIYG
jgi:hypothetical protein